MTSQPSKIHGLLFTVYDLYNSNVLFLSLKVADKTLKAAQHDFDDFKCNHIRKVCPLIFISHIYLKQSVQITDPNVVRLSAQLLHDPQAMFH